MVDTEQKLVGGEETPTTNIGKITRTQHIHGMGMIEVMSFFTTTPRQMHKKYIEWEEMMSYKATEIFIRHFKYG